MVYNLIQSIIFSCILIYIQSGEAATHRPMTFLNKIQNTPNEEEQIFNHFCITCHAEQPMINLGAPRIHHPEDWQQRVSQGLEQILQHVNQGYRAMPARGGCFECTDRQLHRTVLFMLRKIN